MLFLALLPLVGVGDYDGRFKDHPNKDALVAIVEATLERGPEDLPKWLAKEPPLFQINLVDLESPLDEHVWPGRAPASIGFESNRGKYTCTIDLPIDSLIGDPELATFAVRRMLFDATSTTNVLRSSGMDFTRMSEMGQGNPVIDAIASHWAGSIELEIDYALRRNLGSDVALEGLVQEIVKPSGGGSKFQQPDQGADNLTFLVLAQMIAPKKDKALAAIYKAIDNGQPLEGSLKKGTKKKLDKLNRALAEFWGEQLEERFPPSSREPYRAVTAAFESGDMSRVQASLDTCEESPLLAPNLEHFRATVLLRTSEEATAVEMPSYALGPLTVDTYRERVERDVRLEDLAQARAHSSLLRDEFGWLPGVRDEVKDRLKSLGD